MNIPSFAKPKPQGKSYKAEKKVNKPVRMDTEAANPLYDRKQLSQQNSKQSRKIEEHEKGEKTHKMERMHTSIPVDESAETVSKQPKTVLYIKELTKTLWELKEQLQGQYDALLSQKISQNQFKELSQLLASNYFRFRKATFNSVLEEYSNVLQGLELLISKLTNNEKLTEKVLIRNQEDFVLFFKFFFSKPYTLINLPSVRKIIKLLWDQFLFSSLTTQAMAGNLKLWIHGISAPLNPSMNKLHKMSIEKSQEISKLVTHKSNSHVYIGVNDSDTLGLTPLMVAAIAKNLRGVEKLLKNGADPYCCPLTFNLKAVSSSTEETKYGNKTMIRKTFGFKERREPDVIEYLKEQKRFDEIAQILCWQNFYNLKKLRKDSQLSDLLEMFPDCSFQIDWKQYKGMLCFKELPHDVITVSKRSHQLRIDYHVKDLSDPLKKKGFYSLVLTAEPKAENKLFMISHGDKFICNVLEDKDIKSIKALYGVITKQGNIFNPDVSDLKAIYFPQEERLSATFQMYYQNFSSKTHQYPRFRSEKEYFKEVVASEMIDYGQLQKNEGKAILQQSVVRVQKPKNKFFENVCSVDIDWVEQELNLSHLELVLRIAMLNIPHSVLLAKVQKIIEVFQDPVFHSFNYRKKLPLRCKWSSEGQVNLQSQIKNLYYLKLDESIFGLDIRAKELNFDEVEERVDLSHLQDTVFLDEMYSINASRFMGKSELMQEQEEEEANKKFQELLKLQGIWKDDD